MLTGEIPVRPHVRLMKQPPSGPQARSSTRLEEERQVKGMLLLMRWTIGRPYRRWTTKSHLDTRLLADWCDYSPAHRKLAWIAAIDGEPFGQCCTRHLGRLLIDVYRAADADLSDIGIHPR